MEDNTQFTIQQFIKIVPTSPDKSAEQIRRMYVFSVCMYIMIMCMYVLYEIYVYTHIIARTGTQISCTNIGAWIIKYVSSEVK